MNGTCKLLYMLFWIYQTTTYFSQFREKKHQTVPLSKCQNIRTTIFKKVIKMPTSNLQKNKKSSCCLLKIYSLPPRSPTFPPPRHLSSSSFFSVLPKASDESIQQKGLYFLSFNFQFSYHLSHWGPPMFSNLHEAHQFFLIFMTPDDTMCPQLVRRGFSASQKKNSNTFYECPT